MKPDSGPRYVDQNADRNPTSPLAALLRAVQSSKPDFDFAAIDVITDRRPIRKLYGFITGDGKPFKFGVTILGNTALFTRMEDRTRDERLQIEYRQAFETAYLKISLSGKDSTSHHRVVRYVFGGMTFLVRSAIDAYLPDRVEELELADGDKQARLTDFVKAMSLSEPTPSLSVFTARVAVITGGGPIPHAATLELSTRSNWAPKIDLLARKLPDLWISQTANFMEAYHGSGNSSFGPQANRGKWRGALQSSSSNGQPRPTDKSGGTTQSLKSNIKSHPSGNGRGMPQFSVSSSDSHLLGKGRGFLKPSNSDREPQQTGIWKGATKPSQSNSDHHMTKFTDIKIKPLATQLVTWEAANAKTLGALVVMIKKVIEATKELQGPCIVSYDGKEGRVLEVCRAMEGEVVGLPQELEDLFMAVRG